MKLRLSDRADADITGIFDYSLRTWGIVQAAQYRNGLVSMLDTLTDDVDLGRKTDLLPDDILRVKYEHHFIFYQLEADGILIARVLHERMDHVRHLT